MLVVCEAQKTKFTGAWSQSSRSQATRCLCVLRRTPPKLYSRNERKPLMSRILIVFALLCAGLSILTLGSYASSSVEHQGANDSSVQQVNAVVQWNRTLLVIVRTPGAQPATVHPTRSFAILHA